MFKTRRYRTMRDGRQGNNRKVIKHMGKNITEQKSKGIDKGVIWCTGGGGSPQRNNK